MDADDLETGDAGEKHPEAFRNARLVLDDGHADGLHGRGHGHDDRGMGGFLS
jgi:hypothetical protein